MDFIIVESPSKAKTIEKYLKKKYVVDASGGHIRDLPEKTLGVDIKNNFEPKYVVAATKKDVIKRLTEKSKKVDRVFLATDPDREGEAISWHLAKVLHIDEKSPCRIVFNEISEKAILEALKNPRTIDINLVDAQQARRVLDRLVGYKLSPLLCKKIQDRLSAGRVQSVALRLIVERECEIREFVPKEYWTIQALLSKKGQKTIFTSDLVSKGGKKLVPQNQEEVNKILSDIDGGEFVVSDVKEGVSHSKPQPPFTTSTLQQDASTKINFTSQRTMMIAQQLYEGIDIKGEGHKAFVTYIRTDSVRVSEDAQKSALAYIENKFGNKYVPSKPNFYATKKNAQDAHEAIRPISIDVNPEDYKDKLTKEQYKLYKLIYNRFLASQMAQADYATVNIKFNVNGYDFKTVGKTLLFDGYTAVYKTEKNDDEEQGLLPKLEKGECVDKNEIKTTQKFTKPPARYTDASLIKTLEQKGIGRPSTYATIISVIAKRQYTAKEGKNIFPTELGFSVNDLIVKYFDDIINTEFTAKMEERLDEIEEGGKDWHSIVGEFFNPFNAKLSYASTDGDEQSDELCPKCGNHMIIKNGKYGKYLACSNYPTCKNIISLQKEEVSEEKCPKCGELLVYKVGKYGKYLACKTEGCKFTKSLETVETGEVCPNCSHPLVIKNGKYGKYLACSNAECKFTKNINEVVGVCPDCGGEIVKKRSKTGKLFYGCSNYPTCKFASWDIPLNEKCPTCGKYLIKKYQKGGGVLIRCSDLLCKYSRTETKQDEENNDD